MTMQVRDAFIHNHRVHSFDKATGHQTPQNVVELAAAMDGFTHAIFDPVKTFGVRPTVQSTANWRGSICEYRVVHGHLVLSAFYLMHWHKYKPETKIVLGVKPVVKYLVRWTNKFDEKLFTKGLAEAEAKVKAGGKWDYDSKKYTKVIGRERCDELFVCYQKLHHPIPYTGTICITPVDKDEPRMLTFANGMLTGDSPADPALRGKLWGYVEGFYNRKSHRNMLRPGKGIYAE